MLHLVDPKRSRIAELPHGGACCIYLFKNVNQVMKLTERKKSCQPKNTWSRKTENRSSLCSIKIWVLPKSEKRSENRHRPYPEKLKPVELSGIKLHMGEYPTDVKSHSPVPIGISAPYAERESILCAEPVISAIKNVPISMKHFARSWTEPHLFAMAANKSVHALSENNSIGQIKHKKVMSSFYLRLVRDSISQRLR